ncbi:MAG: diguanylate cyclase [Cypionkella sp.]
MVLVLLGFAAVAVPGYAAFNWIVNSTMVQLGTLFAEKQILYDRYRGLQSLTREVSLSETLAGSQAIRDWALDEADPQKRSRAIAELEHYRKSFADRSYFFVVDSSGHYYFNDAANSHAGNQLAYTIDPASPDDGWYFRTRALGEGCHLNVDNSPQLRLTKVWINCVIREGRKVLGILGSGLDLSAFIREVVNVPQVGVTSMFIDGRGAIQAHRDQSLVDDQSVNDGSVHKTVFDLLQGPDDQVALQQLMDEAKGGDGVARSRFMQVGGRQVLVGVGYLDKLDWYNVTLMDVDAIIDKRLFLPIGVLLATVMALVMSVMVLVFKRQVLDRIERLELAVVAVRGGNYARAGVLAGDRQDEIGRLSGAFADMARSVAEQTRDLEARVLSRTEELQALAFKDGQTGVANRRGILATYRSLPQDRVHGVLLIDIDHFKQINDNYGHAAGDVVVIEIARRIQQAAGSDSHCARWGGDEFMLLLVGGAPSMLRAMAYGLMAQIREHKVTLPDGRSISVTVSIGACLAEPGEKLERATDMADAALYLAKNGGRNRVVVFDSEGAAVEKARGGLS